MPANNHYPSLKRILPINSLPPQLGTLQGVLQEIFNKIYYKNYIVEKSYLGDTAFYRLTLVSYDRLGFEIPGTGGLALVLNPALNPNDTNFSEIDVSLSYNLEIVKYIKGLKPSNFSEDPIGYFFVLTELIGLSPRELLSEAITVFNNNAVDPIQKFVDDYNLEYPDSPISINNSGNTDTILNLALQIDEHRDVLKVIYDGFISTAGSLSDILDTIKQLFKTWINDFDYNNIIKLFIPQVSASIDSISAALEFPRSIFQPLLPNGQINPDENVKAQLKFNVGSVLYSTQTGLEFVNESSLDFTESAILNSGFTLKLQKMKLDLSRTKNIPEAIADGRPDDFIGVYI
ncbi:MAG TPA: hypothetical protein VFF27_07520, partial [Bacteroidia bacterium]|nr:hypothetical protein [Bacteroidia bacterium]